MIIKSQEIGTVNIIRRNADRVNDIAVFYKRRLTKLSDHALHGDIIQRIRCAGDILADDHINDAYMKIFRILLT